MCILEVDSICRNTCPRILIKVLIGIVILYSVEFCETKIGNLGLDKDKFRSITKIVTEISMFKK